MGAHAKWIPLDSFMSITRRSWRLCYGKVSLGGRNGGGERREGERKKDMLEGKRREVPKHAFLRQLGV